MKHSAQSPGLASRPSDSSSRPPRPIPSAASAGLPSRRRGRGKNARAPRQSAERPDPLDAPAEPNLRKPSGFLDALLEILDLMGSGPVAPALALDRKKP